MADCTSNSIEANRANFNVDWRAKKPVFDEQMAHFCMQDDMADVEFVFNRQNKTTVYLSYYIFIRHFYGYFLEDSCSFICAYRRLRSVRKRACL